MPDVAMPDLSEDNQECDRSYYLRPTIADSYCLPVIRFAQLFYERGDRGFSD
jgi:hypothetical protein